jgi:hypothetical protein
MKRKLNVAPFLIALASLILVSQAIAQGADVAVIVNPNISMANVTMAELRKSSPERSVLGRAVCPSSSLCAARVVTSVLSC